MSYRADETAEQRSYKLAAIEFVRKASERARQRKALREGYDLLAYSELAETFQRAEDADYGWLDAEAA